jgi:TATA-box binding protein (TBP) (component of TFIID and TFIIIB)
MNPSFATPYRVSTITCNGSIGKSVGEVYLDLLFQVIPIIELTANEKGFVYMIDKTGKESKGILPKKEKKSQKNNDPEEVYKKRRFDNAISGYFKLGEGYYPSVKIFKNGTIQMTGVKTIEEGKLLNEKVFNVIQGIIASHPTIVKNNCIESSEFYVRLINSDFSIPYHIRRKDLHHLLISQEYGNTSSFQPGTYPGVKLQYFWNQESKTHNGICNCKEKCFGKGNGIGDGNCKKITVSIFESGKILITGAINFQQIDNAYSYITTLLERHKHTLQKVIRPMTND